MNNFRVAHDGFVHRQVSSEVLDHGSTAFDLVDGKGRQLGFCWHIEKLTTRPETEEERTSGWGGYIFEDTDTVRFIGRTHATRNGKRFGASVPGIEGKTIEEVRQGVVARATSCEKRYAKLVAKGSV